MSKIIRPLKLFGLRGYLYILLSLAFFSVFSLTVLASAPILKNGLSLGDTGNQVTILQSKLGEDRSLYPSDVISGYYGSLTQQAVIKFQQRYGLSQTGNVDSYTLEKFNQVYGDTITSVVTPIPNKSVFQNFIDFVTSPIRSIMGLFSKNTNQSVETVTNTETNSIPTQIPIPTTYYVAPTTDPDPFVNCNINANCGGGTKLLRSSVCNQSTCCQIGNNWIFYESTNQCTIDQNNYNKNSQSSNNTNNGYQPTHQQNSNNNIPTIPNISTVPCILSYGTYYFMQDECDKEKAADQQQQQEQQQDMQNRNNTLNQQIQQQNLNNYNNCVNQANVLHNEALANCSNENNYDSGCRGMADQGYRQLMGTCDNMPH